MSQLVADLRFAVRSLARSRGFTAVAIATLALGIGATTAVFSVVEAVLLEPLPFPEPERLVVLYEEQATSAGPRRDRVSALNFQDWQAAAESFDSLAAWLDWDLALSGAGDPESILALRASASLFEVLGVTPALGRGFLPEEEQPGRERVAILSHGLWERRFGADPGLIGRSVTFDGEPYTVVGVMPPGFRFPDDPDIEMWVPLAFAPREVARRTTRMFHAVGRLAPGVSPEQAREEMAAIGRRLAVAHPEANAGYGVAVEPAREAVLGPVREPLLVLFGAVGFVMVVACANAASLLLARGAQRERELALRRALGAGRGRLLRLLLAESLVLSGLGGAAGLLLAAWGVRVLTALDTGHLPGWNAVGIDGGVLAFATGAALVTALLAGILPAVAASGAPASSLREGAAVTVGPARRRAARWLVAAEVALSVVLLTGAGLMARSLQHLLAVDPGFRPQKLLAAAVFLPDARYQEDAQQIAFLERLLERVRALPGAAAVGGVTALPMSPVGIDHDIDVAIPGTPSALAEQKPQADHRIASEGYFRAVGIPLLRGRDFTTADRPDAPRVAIVNRTLVERLLPPGEDPIGRTLLWAGRIPMEIVGVVGDVRFRSLDAEPRPEVYVPYRQMSYGSLTVVVRAEGDPGALADLVRREVFALDSGLPVTDITTAEELVHRSTGERRFTLALLGAFAGLAVLLAGFGILGVVSHAVSRRSREIGIRLALGARPFAVRAQVVGESLVPVVAGSLVGGLAAIALSRFLAAQLFGISPADPLALGGAVLALLGVAIAAADAPARRAARIDPLTVLRSE